MEPVLFILAFAGISALLIRLLGAAFRLLQRSGEAWIAAEAARSRQARGDLTGLGEAAGMEARARRARRTALANVAFCVILLLVPLLTPWTLEIYAACSILWLARGRLRTSSVVDVQRGPR